MGVRQQWSFMYVMFIFYFIVTSNDVMSVMTDPY
jgi:hypothetical protein